MADEDDSYPPMHAKRTPICIFFKDVRYILLFQFKKLKPKLSLICTVSVMPL
jgi:hypothetical protein